MSRVEHLSDDVTLYLGDCREILPGLGEIGHFISDPPYEQISQDRIGGIKRNDGGRVTQKLDFAGIDEIRDEITSRISWQCKGWVALFCTAEGVAMWRDAIELHKIKYKCPMIWVKPDAMPKFNGQGPALGYENIVTAWNGQGPARWNAGGNRGVYTHCVNVGRQGEHPTEKPVPLMCEIVEDFTSPGDLVCDPFMGSGTTGIACVRYGRGFVGIEQNERWFDLARKRISDELRRPRLNLTPAPAPIQEAMQL